VPLYDGESVDLMQVHEPADFSEVLSPDQIERFEAQRSGN
jgi:hypothetical protein